MSIPNYFEAVEQPGGAKIAADGLTDPGDGLAKRVQVIKIAGGPADAYELVPGSAARGLVVEVSGFGTTIRSAQVTVTTTATLLSGLAGAAALANRKSLMLVNTGSERILLGGSNVTCFIPLDPGVPFFHDWASGIDPWLKTATATSTLAVLETA